MASCSVPPRHCRRWSASRRMSGLSWRRGVGEGRDWPPREWLAASPGQNLCTSHVERDSDLTGRYRVESGFFCPLQPQSRDSSSNLWSHVPPDL